MGPVSRIWFSNKKTGTHEPPWVPWSSSIALGSPMQGEGSTTAPTAATALPQHSLHCAPPAFPVPCAASYRSTSPATRALSSHLHSPQQAEVHGEDRRCGMEAWSSFGSSCHSSMCAHVPRKALAASVQGEMVGSSAGKAAVAILCQWCTSRKETEELNRK